MYKILIDSREREKNKISLFKDNRLVTEVEVKDIMTGLKNLLENQKLNVSNIEKFELVNEPGSFTGLKVGASIVNALNFANGKINSDTDIVIPNYGSNPNISQAKSSHS